MAAAQDSIAAILAWLPVKSLVVSNPKIPQIKIKFHVCDFNLDPKEQVPPLGKPVSSTLEQVHGHCRGLILLSRSSPLCPFKLALWNPSTRRCSDLSDCPPLVPGDVYYPDSDSDCPSLAPHSPIIGLGLGYHESRAKFKVFCLVRIIHYDEEQVQVWVYDLKSISWRRIQNFPCLSAIQFPPGSGHYADGGVHWLCKLSDDPNRLAIVSVDFSTKNFSVEPLPAAFALNPNGLHVLDGSLCISNVSNFLMPRADLHVRKKDGDGQFYWIQICSTAEQPVFDWFLFGFTSVLGCLKKGDKVLLDLGQFGLLLYDLKAKCFERVEIGEDANWKRPILCPESLVSVDGSA